MKNDKITISDIAAELKVSAISVSRAISGQPGVSDELRQKILLKAKELGYVRIKNSNDINILILHQRPYLQDNSNFSCKVQGIESSLQDIGVEYNVEFIDNEKQNNLFLPTKLSKPNKFDGVIFIGRFSTKYADFLKSKIPNQIFFCNYTPNYECDSVWYNFNNSSYKQCKYLINKGHKNIGFVESKSEFKNKEKLLGITLCMNDHNLKLKDKFIFHNEDHYEVQLIKMIKENNYPSAVICQCDFTAIKLIKALYENGIRVPEDISIIGSGNSEMASLSIPGLTTLDYNIPYSCKAAVELLMKRINFPNKPYENITINSKLIERASVKAL